MDVDRMRRVEIKSGDTVGVVLEPEERSGSFAVVLGGSMGGIPEPLATRLAASGITTFALGYFGAPGLPSALVEIPLEVPQRGIELFTDRWARGRSVGLIGASKGAELALLLASQLPDVIGPTIALAPSNVAWYGIDMREFGGPTPPSSVTHSSWTWRGSPWPFLPLAEGRMPIFTEQGLRTDVCYDLNLYDDTQINTARIPIERARGPILLLSGDDDHQWPSAAMAGELARRMDSYGRSEDLTNVVYPGAGHVFAMHDWMPPSTMFDFGGDAEADASASADAWRRIPDFLARGSASS